MQVSPKDKYVEETRSLTKLSREMEAPETVSICGLELIVFPQVFNPGVFFSSCWFAKAVSKFVQKTHAQSFCEVGSGTGIVSITIAKENEDVQITACDVNPEAVRNTQENAERTGVQIAVSQSDVFSKISGKFDVIFWALPFGYLESGENVDLVDTQTFDPGYRAIETFFKDGATRLNPSGTLLFGFSPEIGHMELITTFADRYGWELSLVEEEEGTEKSSVRMQIYAALSK